MNLKTYAEDNGFTLDEAKEITGLTHWNQSVPESCDELQEVAEDEETISYEEVVEAVPAPAKPTEPSEAEKFSLLILGNKSPYWK